MNRGGATPGDDAAAGPAAVPPPVGASLAPLTRAAVAAVFIVAYTIVAFAGLSLQSAQAGVTPVWPPSGLAFAVAFWLGGRYALLIIPAMLFLGWVIGVPLPVAVLAGVGSVGEAMAAAWMMRRSGADPSLLTLSDTLRFVLFAAVLAPVVSAVVGASAMTWFTAGPVDWLLIVPMWWLGNSLGILIIGGLGLVLPGPKTFPRYSRHWVELLALCALAVLTAWLGMAHVHSVASPLILYALMPLIVVAGLRIGQFGVLAVAALVLFVFMLGNDRIPHEQLGVSGLGLLYLDISLVWMAVFSGLIVGSAMHEKKRREDVFRLASRDELTQLVNRGELVSRLARALVTARAQGRSHALLYVDLDRFKQINDAEGHAAGDRVLRDVGEVLRAEVRGRDTVARQGGDEFVLLLESCPLIEACGIAENIRRALESYVYRGVHGSYQIEASIGVVEVDGQAASVEAIMHGADMACYEAKHAGRNRVWVGSPQLPPESGQSSA